MILTLFCLEIDFVIQDLDFLILNVVKHLKKLSLGIAFSAGCFMYNNFNETTQKANAIV